MTDFEKRKEEIVREFEEKLDLIFSRAHIPEFAMDAKLPILGGFAYSLDLIARDVARKAVVEEKMHKHGYGCSEKGLCAEIQLTENSYNIARTISLSNLKTYGVDVTEEKV